MAIIVYGTRPDCHSTPSGSRMVTMVMVAVMPTGIVSMEVGIVIRIVPHVAVVITGISPIASPVVSPTIIPMTTPSVGIAHHVV